MYDLKHLLELLEKLDKEANWFVGEANALIRSGRLNERGIDYAIRELQCTFESLTSAFEEIYTDSWDPQQESDVCSTNQLYRPGFVVDPARAQEINKSAIGRLKDHFEEWSGGFPPESKYQVTVYIDYAMPFDFQRTAAREVLLEWLEDDANNDYVSNDEPRSDEPFLCSNS